MSVLRKPYLSKMFIYNLLSFNIYLCSHTKKETFQRRLFLELSIEHFLKFIEYVLFSGSRRDKVFRAIHLLQ